MFCTSLMYILVAVALIMLIELLNFLYQRNQYNKSSYCQETQSSFKDVYMDKGKSGEYGLVSYSEQLDGYKRFLINCYLPKPDGTTSEIDVILLHESGIYVLEAKNYSGWIFGSENQQYWTETFSDGYGGSKKYRFYNPIWQNNAHIQALNHILADDSIPIYSGIIFSDECELMQIDLTSDYHCVVNCRDLLPALQENCERVGRQLSAEKIDEIYNRLYPFTQVSDEVKAQHAEQASQAKSNFYHKY